ncbi:hypothetical protein AaE_014100 [Aphanomyces astaci]|uniref:Tc1-like transposase DDE domain-containing protein n=1 Tax=Aphanomyces astaci TaxID=112090 RepID=A0A6A4Z1J8_APHAT|nr:hypothetical protein AaE_014100 [Aphanomyces astaci]
MAAIARPRVELNSDLFDGKIGVWSFVEQVAAQRNSKKRTKGTLVTTSKSVDAKVYLDMVLGNVVPAIKAKFHHSTQRSGILIQQDNASSHKSVTTALLESRGISDLGFFNSIQSLQKSFYESPVNTVSKTLITLQKVMENAIEMHGSNDYKLPHMKKDACVI